MMNERIQELAEQAWRATSDEVAHLNRMHNRAISHDEQMDIFEQKFAELIVKEMLVTCVKHPTWTGRMIGNQIKEHFGVE
jgi:hypothetical protein